MEGTKGAPYIHPNKTAIHLKFAVCVWFSQNTNNTENFGVKMLVFDTSTRYNGEMK